MKTFIMHFLSAIIGMGYFGVGLALAIEIIPSELVLSYGGFIASQGRLSFVGTVMAGTIGILIAQVILYWIGRYGGRPFLKKYGKYLLIHEKHIDKADSWFQRYGSGVVFFARFVPVLRQVISIPAGIAKMSVTRFLLYTLFATVPWSILFIFIGAKLGQNWDQIKTVTGPYIDVIAIIIIAFFALYLLFKYRKNRQA